MPRETVKEGEKKKKASLLLLSAFLSSHFYCHGCGILLVHVRSCGKNEHKQANKIKMKQLANYFRILDDEKLERECVDLSVFFSEFFRVQRS